MQGGYGETLDRNRRAVVYFGTPSGWMMMMKYFDGFVGGPLLELPLKSY
jgi:hypothetical protein